MRDRDLKMAVMEEHKLRTACSDTP